MSICSAPGRVCLFGEHAVVYGEPAIACAISLRARVSAKKSKKMDIKPHIAGNSPYILSAIEEMEKLAGFEGVSINVTSEIPVASGLGSSAAITVASLGALNKEFCVGLTDKKIAALGHKVERSVQGLASPMDTMTSALGGVLVIPEGRKLRSINCGIVVGNTGIRSDTREEVRKVAALKKNYPYVTSQIIRTIGDMVGTGETCIRKGDCECTGELMNINHMLLGALGVGCAELTALADAARKGGALGAKITGAGGGGCIVSITRQPDVTARAIKKAGGLPIKTKVSGDGLRYE